MEVSRGSERVEAALQLVRKQRRIVDATQIGSPAHRQASDVLALIEESHFLLCELDGAPTPWQDRIRKTPAPATSIAPEPRPARARRLPPLELVAVFAAAIVAAAVLLEIADPAPMDLRADPLATMSP